MNKLSVFFGSCSLETGAFIIGMLEHIRSFIKLELEYKRISIDINKSFHNFTIQVTAHNNPPIPSDLNITYALILSFTLLFSIIYVIGVNIKCSRLVEPLLFTMFGNIWFTLLLGVSNILAIADNANSLYVWIFEIESTFIGPVIHFYGWSVVYRYYKAILDEKSCDIQMDAKKNSVTEVNKYKQRKSKHKKNSYTS